MDVMTAGMHDRHGASRAVGGGDGAGIIRMRILLDRKRVKLGAEKERFALAVLKHGNHAIPTDALGNVIPGGAQLISEALGGLRFLVGKLGVGVEVEIELLEVGVLFFNLRFDLI